MPATPEYRQPSFAKTLLAGRGQHVRCRDVERMEQSRAVVLWASMTKLSAVTFNRWLILACMNGTVPVAIIWRYHAGEISYSVALISSATVLAVGNAALLLAFWKCSKRDGYPLRKSQFVGAGALAILAFLSTILSVASVKQRNEYADLAASDKPLSAIEPEQKRIVVELIRRQATISHLQNMAMAEIQKQPMNPVVYAPESFADKRTIRSTLTHLTEYSEIDFQTYDKQRSARADFHQKMAICDPEYLKKWDAERGEQEAKENSANQLEHDWFTSVSALYVYAEQHTKDIAVRKGEISISDAVVRQRLNDLLNRSKALHEELESTVQDEVRLQQQAKARIAD